MGAWACGPFDNDDASDWVYELEGADDLGLCRDAIEEAALVSGYLDLGEGARAMAAAEVLAAAAGRRGGDLPEDVDAWLDTIRPEATSEDLAMARRAVERVKGRDSELAELWAESDSRIEWVALADDLLKRLA
jgi:hypothetical protein